MDVHTSLAGVAIPKNPWVVTPSGCQSPPHKGLKGAAQPVDTGTMKASVPVLKANPPRGGGAKLRDSLDESAGLPPGRPRNGRGDGALVNRKGTKEGTYAAEDA